LTVIWKSCQGPKAKITWLIARIAAGQWLVGKPASIGYEKLSRSRLACGAVGEDTVHNRAAGRQITANPAALPLIKLAAVTRFCIGFDFHICGCGNRLLLAASALGTPDLAAISFLVATAVADDSLSL
jgi:hypothetical protein